MQQKKRPPYIYVQGLTGLIGPTGPQGNIGPTGPTGPQGDISPTTSNTIRNAYLVTFNDGTSAEGIAVDTNERIPIDRVELNVSNLVTVDTTEEEPGPEIYYKQTASDGEHTFSTELQNITMTQDTQTVEITNPQAAARTFNLTDTNYANLPIADGTVTLTNA